MTRLAQRRRPQLLAVLLSFVMVTLGLIGVSAAGFSGTTNAGSNAWTTGTVALTDTDSGNALFKVANDGLLDAGQTLTRCINVTYNGTLTNNLAVRLYGTSAGALAPYLNLTVTEGTGANGTAGSCTGFTPTSTLYNGTLDGFATTRDTFAHGVSTWAITAAPQTRSYRFVTAVADVNASQAKTATANFTWTAAAPPAPAPDGATQASAVTLNLAAPIGSTATTVMDLSKAQPFEQWEKDAGLLWAYEDARVWYRIVPAATGVIEVNTFPGPDMPSAACSTVLSPVVGAAPNTTWMDFGPTGYAGFDTYAQQSLEPEQTCNGQSRIAIRVTAGTPALMFVQPNSAADRVESLLRVRMIATDTNDNIANATPILPLAPGQTQTVKMMSFGAGTEPGEPNPVVDGSPAATQWFTYTPTRNQTLTFDLNAYKTNRYTTVRLFSGGPAFNSLTQIKEFAKASTGGTATLTAGQTYYLQTLTNDFQTWDYFTITSN